MKQIIMDASCKKIQQELKRNRRQSHTHTQKYSFRDKDDTTIQSFLPVSEFMLDSHSSQTLAHPQLQTSGWDSLSLQAKEKNNRSTDLQGPQICLCHI